MVFDIPVFLHNFRGYDSHLIVIALFSHQYRTCEIQVIGQNMERYMQLKWVKHLVFRDLLIFIQTLWNRWYSPFAKTMIVNLSFSKL